MSERLHTIFVSRHYAHVNNYPTPAGKEDVIKNTKSIQDQRPKRAKNVHVLASNEARTIGTGFEIAKTLKARVDGFQIKDYLNLEPKNGPMRETLKKLNEHYEKDENIVAKKGFSDEFVYKMTHNQLDGVNFAPFGVFNTTKLLNGISAIKRNSKESNMTIVGIHGGYALESILYTLRGDNLPEKWKGQIKMGENLVMGIDRNPKTNEISLVITYRGESRTISEDEIRIARDKLKETSTLL